MRLASAPITWGVCEMEGWGEILPRSHVLAEMVDLGYEGTELGPPGYLPEDPAALQAVLGMRGLNLVDAFCPMTLHKPDGFEPALGEALRIARLLREAGADLLLVADAGGPDRRARSRARPGAWSSNRPVVLGCPGLRRGARG